jgi:ketosteroid isomerase-like protein
MTPNDEPGADNVAILDAIYGPLERGETDDLGQFFDTLADDIVFQTPVLELRGRDAVATYLSGAELVEFEPFERPLEYFAAGNRVVQLGSETFQVNDTGAIHRAEWAWVYDFHDGKITRILEIQDLGDIRDVVAEVARRAQAGSSP